MGARFPGVPNFLRHRTGSGSPHNSLQSNRMNNSLLNAWNTGSRTGTGNG